MIYDTLKLSRSLRERAHFTAEQSEGLAEALSDAAQGDLATKGDISELKSSVSGDISELKINIAELKSNISELKSELLKWIIGTVGVQTIAIIIAVAHWH